MSFRKLPLISLAVALSASTLVAQEPRGTVTFGNSLDSLTVGGSLRFRLENRDNTPPLMGASGNTVGAMHARVFLDAAFSERLNAKVEFQHVVMDTGKPSDEFLRQAWMTWSDIVPGGELKVGRFQMNLGNQRMVSELSWSMVGRAWDGALWSQDFDDVDFKLFWTQPVEGMAVPVGLDQAFGGAYFTFDAGILDVDTYAFTRRDRMMGGNGRNDQTFGVLMENNYESPLNWSAEVATQTGDNGAEDAGGSAAALRIDFDVTERLVVGVGYELATGDDTPGDGKNNAFEPLFDFGHAYHGTQDLFDWSNLQDIVLRTSLKLDDNWVLSLDLHDFRLAEEGGAISNSALTAVAGETHLGTEIDLAVRGNLHENINLWAGVSAFQAGDAIMNGDDQMWFFANLEMWL